jgi:hypothetical protein
MLWVVQGPISPHSLGGQKFFFSGLTAGLTNQPLVAGLNAGAPLTESLKGVKGQWNRCQSQASHHLIYAPPRSRSSRRTKQAND